MNKIVKTGMIGIFCAYWLTTVFFTLPDNHLNLSLFKEAQTFHLFFFQKWGFFAPPPTSNERAYYTFIPKIGEESKTFEIVEPITKKKKQDAPFNWRANTIDYVISNSIIGISETLYEEQQVKNYELTNTDTSSVQKDYDKLSKELVQGSAHFKILVNYAKIVAQKQDIELSDYDLSILITQKKIPKFYKRFEKNNTPEIIIFQSDTLSLVETPVIISMH